MTMIGPRKQNANATCALPPVVGGEAAPQGAVCMTGALKMLGAVKAMEAKYKHRFKP